MDELQLLSGETVLLQISNACRYHYDECYDIDELYLTNKNIICVQEESKGIFFTKKEAHITKIPLTQIMVNDGIPQVEQIKDKTHGKSLRIVYTTGEYDLFELYDSPKKNYSIWKTAITSAVMQVHPVEERTKNESHKFCVNCGTPLPQKAKFCGKCGVAVSEYSTSTIDPQVGITESNKQSFPNIANKPEPHKLIVIDKKHSLRKKYIISDSNGHILYTAKSEGLPKMPEIVIYNQDKPVGRIERDLFSKPILGGPEYTLQWNGQRFASLYRKITLKVTYDIPEMEWRFERGLMTSNLYDKNDSVIVEIGTIISTGNDRYSVEYYDDAIEPAAVLFSLVVAMSIDLN